ncbi:olfactory receptor 14C36 [Calypte anna]|uniref:olfactory receptor 14C36 n=1 Tax=Calypte anna TaxID=9244 RepID=UPI0011C4A2EA|nr:olfactory receptor 14C36 [Calypte anna]
MSNSSSISQFLLLAFADRWKLQLLHFWLFLGIYLAALLGDGLIITTIACDHHLHIPMYFFLLNLSLLDLGSISTTLPKAMANSLWDNRDISCKGCAAQLFLFAFLISAEFSLLTIMSYDCYVAICKPLHYRTLLGSRACVHMAAAAWGPGFVHALLHTANTFSLPLCQGNALDYFFCEIPQILKLSCSHCYLRELGLLVQIFIEQKHCQLEQMKTMGSTKVGALGLKSSTCKRARAMLWHCLSCAAEAAAEGHQGALLQQLPGEEWMAMEAWEIGRAGGKVGQRWDFSCQQLDHSPWCRAGLDPGRELWYRPRAAGLL